MSHPPLLCPSEGSQRATRGPALHPTAHCTLAPSVHPRTPCHSLTGSHPSFPAAHGQHGAGAAGHRAAGAHQPGADDRSCGADDWAGDHHVCAAGVGRILGQRRTQRGQRSARVSGAVDEAKVREGWAWRGLGPRHVQGCERVGTVGWLGGGKREDGDGRVGGPCGLRPRRRQGCQMQAPNAIPRWVGVTGSMSG